MDGPVSMASMASSISFMAASNEAATDSASSGASCDPPPHSNPVRHLAEIVVERLQIEDLQAGVLEVLEEGVEEDEDQVGLERQRLLDVHPEGAPEA